MFVNSGSEANDVAIQIARAVTGNRGAVITEHAYHGTTAATAALSPEELGPAALEPWVARIGGAATLGAPDAAERVAGEVDAAFGRLRDAGHGPAFLICDDVFSSDGIFPVPPGYLRAAYERARLPAPSASPTRCRRVSAASASRSGASPRTGSSRTSSRSASRWATAIRWAPS